VRPNAQAQGAIFMVSCRPNRAKSNAMTFDIFVRDDEKRPQVGSCVEVDLPQSFASARTEDRVMQRTDEDGRARFEWDEAVFGEVTIFVNGDNKGRFDLEDGAEFTVVT